MFDTRPSTRRPTIALLFSTRLQIGRVFDLDEPIETSYGCYDLRLIRSCRV